MVGRQCSSRQSSSVTVLQGGNSPGGHPSRGVTLQEGNPPGGQLSRRATLQGLQGGIPPKDSPPEGQPSRDSSPGGQFSSPPGGQSSRWTILQAYILERSHWGKGGRMPLEGRPPVTLLHRNPVTLTHGEMCAAG